MKTSSFLRLTLAAMALLAAATAARAQTVISSLPYVVSAGGNYVLNSNLNSTQTSGNLIEIDASNVTIDFQDHYISGPASNTTFTTVGIYATERSNLTIKNGTIAHCDRAVYITGNGTASTNNVDHLIDTMRITYCNSYGIYLNSAPSSVVSNCLISQISNGTNYAAGIYVVGSGVTVQNNAVSNVYTTCIYLNSGNFGRQNQVSNCQFGLGGSSIYQDNLSYHCTNTAFGGTDGGGNFSS